MKRPLSLVTGACGFMGTHMVEQLHAAGHRVRATDLEKAYQKDDPGRHNFPGILKDLKTEFIPSDLTKPETLAPLVADVDYVFHIAGLFNYTAPYSALKAVNVDGTVNLLKLLVEHKTLKRLVLWGAGGVYGMPSARGNVTFAEDLAPMPGNDYLRSKWEAEFAVMEWGHTKKIPYSIIRPTTVYGPRQTYGGGALIMSAAKPFISMVPCNFTFRIPFIHVEDVCLAALFLAQHPNAEGEVFNVNDDSRMSTIDFFKFTARAMGHVPVVIPPVPLHLLKPVLGNVVGALQSVWRLFSDRPTPLEKPSIEFLGEDFLYSNEKLKALGYQFKYPDARQGLLATLAWYRTNGWL